MPEFENQPSLEESAIASAVSVTAEPVSFWETLVADPSFILTKTTAPSREAAFDRLLEEANAAIASPDYLGSLVIAEGWPSLSDAPATEADLALWRKKIEVYHAEYLNLVTTLRAALPETEIASLHLASTLVETLDTPALAALEPADLFTPDAPEGTAVLTGLAEIVSQTAFSEVPLTAEMVSTDLPDVLATALTEVAEVAFVAVGGTLEPRPTPSPEDGTEGGPDTGGVKTFIGTENDDLIDLDADFQIIDGGDGIDTVRVAGTSQNTYVTATSDGTLLLKQPVGDAAVVLENVERIAFEDGTLAFDDEGLAGQAYRLYQACFDRTPDSEGLGFWIKLLDAGAIDLNKTAEFFLASEEFATVYGPPEELSDIHYLALLYANVLDRAPDLEGFSFWRDAQEQGITRADMLVFFSESAENVTQVAPAIDDGIWYI